MITMPNYRKPLAILFAALTASALGQDFNSGSNGSYGPLNITANTVLDLPPDGVFHCTTINVAAGKELSFRRNALNTPVYLLASGDVTIAGIIQVNAAPSPDPTGGTAGGLGGPGGFDGGTSGWLGNATNSRLAGSGMGPGGGKRGVTGNDVGFGSYGTRGGRPQDGPIYGNELLIPLIGGSGGGGHDKNQGSYGGGGGGAILIAASTKITLSATGGVTAVGGLSANSSYAGSGGAVRLLAPKVFGNGGIGANGLNGGGAGRIRIDSLFKVDPLDSSQKLNIAFNGVVTVGSNMMVFPPDIRLDILEAAGTAIPEGTPAPVQVILPTGAPTQQVVKVQARGFNRLVPIRVALIPDSGDMVTFDTTIDNSGGNPTVANVNVDMPVNVRTQVQVWTR